MIDLVVQLRLKNISVQLAPDLWDLTFGGRAVEGIGDASFIRLDESPILPLELRLKRLFDVAMAFPMLVICSPLLLIIALGIALDSPGSPFFAQHRVG